MTNLSSSLGALVVDRNTWRTRANTAYDSGTWGSGNTWQADYNNEVAAYNSSQASLAAMTTNYNNEVAAYNASQANLATMTTNYNNEVAAYNAALAAPDTNLVAFIGSVTVTDNGTFPALCTFQVTRTGYWFCYGFANITPGNNSLMVAMTVNTSPDGSNWTRVDAGGQQSGVNSGQSTMAYVSHGGVKVLLNNGNYVQFRGWATGSSGNSATVNSGEGHAQFIPTQSYPH